MGDYETVSRMRRSLVNWRLSRGGWLGLGLSGLTVALGLLGPWLAPYQPTAIVGPPFGAPTSQHLLGLDYLGRDALSRFLWGGRTALLLAFIASAIALSIGGLIGLMAGYHGGWVDAVVSRITDLLLAIPSLVLVLLLITGLGSSLWLLVAAVALVKIPRIVRIARAATLEVRTLGYVEAAEARGEGSVYILGREILPNIASPILVDFVLRIASSIVLIASVSFLGLGIQPPTADWGLMISENAAGFGIQPWVIVGPVSMIAFLTIGLSLLLDELHEGDPVLQLSR